MVVATVVKFLGPNDFVACFVAEVHVVPPLFPASVLLIGGIEQARYARLSSVCGKVDSTY